MDIAELRFNVDTSGIESAIALLDELESRRAGLGVPVSDDEYDPLIVADSESIEDMGMLGSIAVTIDGVEEPGACIINEIEGWAIVRRRRPDGEVFDLLPPEVVRGTCRIEGLTRREREVHAVLHPSWRKLVA